DLLRLGTIAPETADRVTGEAPSLTFILAGILSLIAGSLLIRFSIRTLMIAGCVFLGGGLAVYSFATQPWHIYLCHSLLGLSLGLAGAMMQTVRIAGWCRRRRGLAMGIVLTGTSIGGVIVPIISRPLIVAYGWRSAML